MSDFTRTKYMTDLASSDYFGRYWLSDEYGPYIYQFNAAGQLLQTIQPPNAILPFINGKLNFTSDEDPDTGRSANQGIFCARSIFLGRW